MPDITLVNTYAVFHVIIVISFQAVLHIVVIKEMHCHKITITDSALSLTILKYICIFVDNYVI